MVAQANSLLQVKYADGELERLGNAIPCSISPIFIVLSSTDGCCINVFCNPEHKLFVGMLPKNVSEAEVQSLFSKYGTIKDLQILRGAQQTSKGWIYLCVAIVIFGFTSLLYLVLTFCLLSMFRLCISEVWDKRTSCFRHGIYQRKT